MVCPSQIRKFSNQVMSELTSFGNVPPMGKMYRKETKLDMARDIHSSNNKHIATVSQTTSIVMVGQLSH